MQPRPAINHDVQIKLVPMSGTYSSLSAAGGSHDAGMEPCRPKELRSLLKTGGHPTAEFGFPFLLQELAPHIA
jgi:hypothetical protein